MLSPAESAAALGSHVPFLCLCFYAEMQTRKRVFPPEKTQTGPSENMRVGHASNWKKKSCLKIKVIKPKKCIKPDGSLGKMIVFQ